MKIVKRLTIVVFCLLLIPGAAFATAAVKQRFADGPNLVFSGRPLKSGELYTGLEPDWSFVGDVATIEMQLLDPPRSRRRVRDRRVPRASEDGRDLLRRRHRGRFRSSSTPPPTRERHGLYRSAATAESFAPTDLAFVP